MRSDSKASAPNIFIVLFLIIFAGIKDAVFLFQKNHIPLQKIQPPDITSDGWEKI